MRVVAKHHLTDFAAREPKAKAALIAWLALANEAQWHGQKELKEQFGSRVTFLDENEALFSLSGDDYRLLAHISYQFKTVLVHYVGTHEHYDSINRQVLL